MIQDERSILSMVFDQTEYASVRHEDAPDFVLQRDRDGASFGVEVTGLYESESDARVEHHPRYVGQLLSGAAPMHKDDIPTLSVSRVTIHDSDGHLKQADVPAIVRRQPSHATHASALADVVRHKSKLLPGYRADLAHVSLVVLDRFDAPFGPHPEYSVGLVITPDLRTALLDSGYREVFLVSNTPDRHQIYRPLKMLLLIESFYLFVGTFIDFPGEGPRITDSDIAPLFVRAMEQSDLLETSLRLDPGGNTCAFYGGSGIHVSDSRYNILDFRDWQPPPPIALPDVPFSDDLWHDLLEHHRRFAHENDLVCEIEFPVSPGRDT